jgi:hypothetical protein
MLIKLAHIGYFTVVPKDILVLNESKDIDLFFSNQTDCCSYFKNLHFACAKIKFHEENLVIPVHQSTSIYIHLDFEETSPL